MLAARGVPETPEALLGALLEAERDFLIVGFIKAWARAARKKK